MCGLNKQNLSVDDILVGNFPEEKVIPSIWLFNESHSYTRKSLCIWKSSLTYQNKLNLNCHRNDVRLFS
jgi:hypothetical protein